MKVFTKQKSSYVHGSLGIFLKEIVDENKDGLTPNASKLNLSEEAPNDHISENFLQEVQHIDRNTLSSHILGLALELA